MALDMQMPLSIDMELQFRKADVLFYLRQRAAEYLAGIRERYGETQFRRRASAINSAVNKEREQLTAMVRQQARREVWPNIDTLRTVLLLMHCANVVMIEKRNDLWPYDYMAFSRRIGELWEPLCTVCFEFPVRDDVTLFVPPLFREVQDRLAREVREFIGQLNIDDEDKQTLLHYYDQVWQLVTSGEINLELDLHIEIGTTKYVIDCKSGFGSNEKGNMNRLLLVSSVYQNIEPEDYHCLLLVRSSEDENNNYLQILKNSGLWDVSCGDDAYSKVHELSGFALGQWIQENINWDDDIDSTTFEYLEINDLAKYLAW